LRQTSPREKGAQAEAFARVDRQFRFTEVSNQYALLLGYPADALVGILCDASVHLDDVAEVQRAHEKLVQAGTVDYLARTFTRDGALRSLRVRMVEERGKDDQVTGYVRYVTEVDTQSSAESTARSSDEQNRAYVAAMPDPMLRVRRDGLCLDARLSEDYILGFPARWVVNRNIRDLGFPEHVTARAMELIELALYTQELQFCELDVEFGGEIKHFEGRVSPSGTDTVVIIGRDITDRKRALRKLGENERFLEQLANSTPAVIYLYDAISPSILYVNNEIEAMLGYRREDVLGFRGPFWQSVLHPEDLNRRHAHEQNLLANPELDYVPMEYRVRHRDGSWHWILAREAAFLRDVEGESLQILGVATDVTERKRTEEALLESEERHRLLAERASDMISRHDAAGHFIDVSRACGRILGYTPEQLIGRPATDFIHTEDIPHFLAYYRTVIQGGGTGTVEYRARRACGREIYLETSAQAIYSNDADQVEIVCVCRDVSDRKGAELERKSLEEQVQRAQRLESLGLLAGGIAHDFNNVLFPVLSNAECLLGMPEITGEARLMIEEIVENSQKARQFVRRMMAYAGSRSLESATLSMNRIVTDTTAFMKSAIPRNVKLEYDLPEALPAIEGDPVQMQQVVMNLLTNACESMQGEPGQIVLRTRVTRLTAARDSDFVISDEIKPGEYVVLEVRDTGSGMDAATRARIFDPFFTTKFTGRGLGLASTLGIVRSHKGNIRVSSAPGKGTVFSIFIPAHHSEAGESAHELPLNTGKIHGRALVVDDDESVRRVVRRQLESMGMSVEEAVDGKDGVTIFSRRPQDFDVVLLDLVMPQLNGQDTIRALRKVRPACAVVVVSGYSESGLGMLTDAEKPSAFLQKPVTMAKLRNTLHTVLPASTPLDIGN
jgi:PAS domain S-box-containing protein